MGAGGSESLLFQKLLTSLGMQRSDLWAMQVIPERQRTDTGDRFVASAAIPSDNTRLPHLGTPCS